MDHGCAANLERYQTLPKHFPNISQTFPKHSQTLRKHFQKLTPTLPKHFPNTSQTLPKHFPNTSQTLPKHFPNTLETLPNKAVYELSWHDSSACGWAALDFLNARSGEIRKQKYIASCAYTTHGFLSGSLFRNDPERMPYLTMSQKGCQISQCPLRDPSVI